jgi:GAF domain-containing protein
VLGLVVAHARRVLGADGSAVFLRDSDGWFRVRAARGVDRHYAAGIRVPSGRGSVGLAIAERRPVVVADLGAALREDPSFDLPPEARRLVERLARKHQAVLSVPLEVKEDVYGAISLYYRERRGFSAEDVRLATTFADQAALAIENARLRTEAEGRTRELEALYRADERLYGSLRLSNVLQALVDVAADILGADKTTVMVWDERREHLVPGAARGFGRETLAQMVHAPGEGVTTRVALSGEPIAVEDASSDPRVAHRITDREGIRSLLHVPIFVDGAVFGVFGVNYCQPHRFGGEEQRLLSALAHRAAVAIENARLYEQSDRRARELEALYRADEVLHGSLRLGHVLQAFVDVAADILGADKTSIFIRDETSQRMVIGAMRGFGPEMGRLTLEPGEGIVGVVVASHQAVVLEDAPSDPRVVRHVVEQEGVCSLMAIPITVGGEVFGVFGINYLQPHRFSADEQRLLLALAQRTALAIENARLYGQAREAAALQERQRLARDLHDAVTQTLFSASLIADVLPRLWERDAPQGRERLAELRQLTRGALAEMRALLLELRPGALTEVGLGELLQHLVEAWASRTGLPVTLQIEGERALPAEVQVALYRIAQEALGNAAKHAGASRLTAELRLSDERVALLIADDGRGFDASKPRPGHFGLGIMGERAEAIGARLTVDSRAGRGTRIGVVWPQP